MRTKQNMLLAGVAALALVAGTGLASAQAPSKDQGAGGAPSAATQMNGTSGTGMPGAAGTDQGAPATQGKTNGQNGQMGHGANNGSMGRSAQDQNKNLGDQNANPSNRAGKTDQDHNRAAQDNQGTRQDKGMTAQQRENGSTGFQDNDQGRSQQGQNAQRGNGAAAQRGGPNSGGVQLSQAQRTQIRQTVIGGRDAPRVSHVDFDVRVGTVVPRDSIHIVPVPDSLVQIEPRWQGFLYFVYADEVVIVDPNDMTIVAVLDV
jgi:hypothetical protein